MKTRYDTVICHVKAIRQSKRLSQGQLADLVGVKRQAIYDIESGKYVPNTVLALRMAKYLGCRVEDLFREELVDDEQPVNVVEPAEGQSCRVMVAKVRGRLIGYPLTGKRSLNDGFRPADGLLQADGDKVRLFGAGENLDHSIIMLGCDPALSILAAHVSRSAPEIRINCRFASSERALEGLAAGHAHLGGAHLHNTETAEANVLLARRLLGNAKATLIAFSRMEEGLMVAPGNPLRIRTVTDLAGGDVRLINREPGAALRALLDDYLRRMGIAPGAIKGYEHEVKGHLEGAQMVAYGFADAALGLRAVAEANGLDFTPIEAVRFDLVIPDDLIDHPAVKVVVDTLQTRKLREELRAFPGYESSQTGSVIAEL